MFTEAQRLAELGVPLDTAINQVVTQYLDKSPEYQLALAKQKKLQQLKHLDELVPLEIGLQLQR